VSYYGNKAGSWKGTKMSAMSNIYTTAMIISELESRMNELEEECVSVNGADDEYPCLCDIHGELDAVYSQWTSVAKEWATFPVSIRNEAMQMAMKEVNA
jgi:hypothetical protein